MPSTCALCLRTRKLKGAEFTNICIDVAEKIKQGYEDMRSIPLSREIFNQKVYRKCYGKYHRHYIRMFENKPSSTKKAKHLLTRRLPLIDCTIVQIIDFHRHQYNQQRQLINIPQKMP